LIRLLLAAFSVWFAVLLAGCTVEVVPRGSAASETSTVAASSDETGKSSASDKSSASGKSSASDKSIASSDQPENSDSNATAEDSDSKKTSGIGNTDPTASPEPADRQNNGQPEQQADKTGSDNKLASKYIDMFEKKLYYMKYSLSTDAGGSETAMDGEMAMNGDSTAMRMGVGGGSMRVVIKDNQTYTIFDDQKTYMASPATQDNSSINTEITDTSGIEFTGSGSEEYHGRMLPYEEYKTDAASVRYYMDGDNLAGIRTIPAEGMSVDMEIVEMSQNIPDGLFDIPSDYTAIGNN